MTKPATINGHEYPIGTAIVRSGATRTKTSSAPLQFGVPNITALLLEHAAKQDLISQDFGEAMARSIEDISLRNAALFDFYEARMVSIVFSFAALEAFANEVISRAYARNYRYEPIKKSTVSLSYDLKTIERSLSLEEKLSAVLPQIFGVDNPKGKHVWNRFQRLKKLRDRIAHCKARDRESSSADDDVLWKALLEPASAIVAYDAFRMMAYFYASKPSEMPRWFANWPYREPKSSA